MGNTNEKMEKKIHLKLIVNLRIKIKIKKNLCIKNNSKF